MKIPPFCRNLGIFYHILGGLHRFCWEAGEMERVRRGRRRRKKYPTGFLCPNHSDKPLRAKIVSAMASTIFESSLHCTISESKEMILPRRPPYFTGKVLPCCIIDGTKCHCTGGMEPCVQWHFLKKHYLLNLCFMYSLAFNSRVSSSGASGSI